MISAQAAREFVTPLRRALYDYDPGVLRSVVAEVFAPDAEIHLAFPFEDLDGPAGLIGDGFGPLAAAMADLERRDYIAMAGPDPYGAMWVGCAGYYTGTWTAPFLGMPATGQQAAMRFHEFFRVEEAGGSLRVVEMQALWDLPEMMMQAGVWPMGPALGRTWHAPAPATADGLMMGERDAVRSNESCAHVVGMLSDMGKHPAEPEEAMRLDHWWHDRFSWYGPAGIGTSRGPVGFRRCHQIPFLAAMPDRRGGYKGDAHFFGDGDYVGVTAWPGMSMTFTGGGWLGLPPTGAAITMRSLDFWRVERQADGLLKIRENWVLVDLLHVYDQFGVDVLARMAELAFTRPT